MADTSKSVDLFKYKPNLTKRIIATLLDYTFVFVPTYIYIMYFGHDNGEGGKTVENIMVLPIVALWFLYIVIVESIFGATFGHQAMSLTVTNLARNKIEFTQALKRHLLDPIDIFIWGIPGIITIKNTDKHQRIGDLWAKTIVLDTKDPEQYLRKKPI